MDVFGNGVWKLYIKTIHDLDPGLNLLENTRARDFERTAGSSADGVHLFLVGKR